MGLSDVFKTLSTSDCRAAARFLITRPPSHSANLFYKITNSKGGRGISLNCHEQDWTQVRLEESFKIENKTLDVFPWHKCGPNQGLHCLVVIFSKLETITATNKDKLGR